MQITKVNYALVVYLALIEGLSLLVLDFTSKYPIDAISGLIVGFIPALIVLSLYKLISESFPIKINGKNISNLPILYLSVANALFIDILFITQLSFANLGWRFGSALLGFSSVLIASIILIAAYNALNFKIKFDLNNNSFKLKRISLMMSVYAGIFEFFILPMMFFFYTIKIYSLFNGLVAGFVGGLIGLWIVNFIISKKPLELL